MRALGRQREQVENGRHDVERGDEPLRGAAGTPEARRGDDQRRAERVVEERVRALEQAVGAEVGRRVADHDRRRPACRALDALDEPRQLAVGRERAFELRGKGALPRGIRPGRRRLDRERGLGEAEVARGDPRQRWCFGSRERRRRRLVPAGLATHRSEHDEAGATLTEPRLEPRQGGGVGRGCGEREVEQIDSPRVQERRERATVRSDERAPCTLGVGIRSVGRGEGAPARAQSSQGGRARAGCLGPEACRQHQHDSPHGRRRRGPARRPGAQTPSDGEDDASPLHAPS